MNSWSWLNFWKGLFATYAIIIGMIAIFAGVLYIYEANHDRNEIQMQE